MDPGRARHQAVRRARATCAAGAGLRLYVYTACRSPAHTCSPRIASCLWQLHALPLQLVWLHHRHWCLRAVPGGESPRATLGWVGGWVFGRGGRRCHRQPRHATPAPRHARVVSPRAVHSAPARPPTYHPSPTPSCPPLADAGVAQAPRHHRRQPFMRQPHRGGRGADPGALGEPQPHPHGPWRALTPPAPPPPTHSQSGFSVTMCTTP